jgi:hypothetical protein
VPEGRLRIALSTQGDSLRVQWRETGLRNASEASRGEGFGSTLERAALAGLQAA